MYHWEFLLVVGGPGNVRWLNPYSARSEGDELSWQYTTYNTITHLTTLFFHALGPIQLIFQSVVFPFLGFEVLNWHYSPWQYHLSNWKDYSLGLDLKDGWRLMAWMFHLSSCFCFPVVFLFLFLFWLELLHMTDLQELRLGLNYK